jgi:2-polyprenyl-3-methyl-5-hydroxy-6-metoxy-1,4-benzoquinol methylase
MRCQVCRQEAATRKTSIYREYSLYHCEICDAMFWIPMKGIEGEIYDTYNVAAALTYLNLRAIPWAHKRFLDDLPQKGGNLLEIGCSSGDFLQKARDAGYSVTGIDNSAQTASFTQHHHGLKDIFPFTVQELLSLKPDEKYDVIAFFQVLEHIDDIPDFINCIKKLLKPGGVIAVSVPNRDRWRIKSERFFRESWDLPPCHLTRWNATSLEKVFTGYGFTSITAEVEPYSLYERAWSNFISQKLGINKLAEIFAGKTVAKQHNGLTAGKGKSLRKRLIGLAGTIYLKVFFPLLALLTLPLKLIVTRQGRTVYFLASLQNPEEG